MGRAWWDLAANAEGRIGSEEDAEGPAEGDFDDRDDDVSEPEALAAPTRDSVLSRRRTRLAVLGGARASVLAKVPGEADRFTQMLPLLVATAILSGISMAFAIATGVLPGQPGAWFAAIPVALAWAALIFVVDRSLTASMKSTKSRGRLAAAAAPRVLLAALIGVVVSGPLVLQIFANDIRQEMVNINLDQGTTQIEQLQQGPEKERLDRASAELTRLQQQAQTGLVAGVETVSQATRDARDRVSTLEGQVAAQRAAVETATNLYSCERYGSPVVDGCTGVAGAGPALDNAWTTMNNEQNALEELQGDLDDARAVLDAAETADATSAASTAATSRDEAEALLPAAQDEYDAALAAYTAKNESITQANSEAVGLIAQMRALEHLQAREPAVAALHWAIAALFFAIELMPVMVKLFRSYGDPNPYELAEESESAAAAAQHSHRQQVQSGQLDHERQLQVDRLTHERDEESRTRDARSQAVWAVEQDMLDRETRIGIEQNERVASQMQVVVGQALDQWEREVHRVFERRPADQDPDLDDLYPSTAGVGGR